MEIFVQLVFLLLFVLIFLVLISSARKKRDKCNWNIERANKIRWGSIVGIGLGLFSMYTVRPGSPLGVVALVLLYVSVYELAKASYRRADLKAHSQEEKRCP